MTILLSTMIALLSHYPTQHLKQPDRVIVSNHYQQSVDFALSCDHISWTNFRIVPNQSESYSCNDVNVKIYIQIVTMLSDNRKVEKQYWLRYGERYYFIVKKYPDSENATYWDMEAESSS